MQDKNDPCETRGLVNWMRKQRKFGSAAQAALDNAASPATNPSTSKHGTMYRCGLSLADLNPGECGYIATLRGSTRGRLRLLEMGLTPGVHVKVVRVAAFGGPLDIQVRGYQLSLRRDEAAFVWLDDPDNNA